MVALNAWCRSGAPFMKVMGSRGRFWWGVTWGWGKACVFLSWISGVQLEVASLGAGDMGSCQQDLGMFSGMKLRVRSSKRNTRLVSFPSWFPEDTCVQKEGRQKGGRVGGRKEEKKVKEMLIMCWWGRRTCGATRTGTLSLCYKECKLLQKLWEKSKSLIKLKTHLENQQFHT